MSDNDRATQAEQLIARMQAARGYIYPEWGTGGPDGSRLHRSLQPHLRTGPGRGRHVSAKVREFVAIALLAFRGADRESLVALCSGPYASAPPKRNCLKSLRPPWFPVEPRRSTVASTPSSTSNRPGARGKHWPRTLMDIAARLRHS